MPPPPARSPRRWVGQRAGCYHRRPLPPLDASHPTSSTAPVPIAGPGLQGVVAAPVTAILEPWLRGGDPAQAPGLHEVKSSRVRRVLAGTLSTDAGELSVHVKLYRAVRLSDHARDALGGSRGVREFQQLAAARARGLPAIEPLAAGSYRGSFGARSFLVTRTVAGTPLPRGPLSFDLAARAGALLRRAHDAGLRARDLHPGNLLDGDDGTLWLLDLHSASFAQPLEEDERARALAFFCLDLDGNVLDGAAQPLVEAYGTSEACLQRAAQHGRRLRHRALEAFGHRATRACRHTAAVREGKVTWFFSTDQRAHHHAAREAVESPPPAAKSGRRGRVHLTDELVIKERSAAAARHLFRAGYWLRYAGVPTAPLVALRLEGGRGNVVTARLHAPTLRDEAAALSPAHAVRTAGALGDAVGRLHAHGLRNRDLKLDNLVRDPRTGQIAMVDLEGVRRRLPLERRGQARDLGRLLAAWRAAGEPGGRPAQRAFLRRYLAARAGLLLPIPANERRHLLRRAEARAGEWAAAHPATE